MLNAWERCLTGQGSLYTVERKWKKARLIKQWKELNILSKYTHFFHCLMRLAFSFAFQKFNCWLDPSLWSGASFLLRLVIRNKTHTVVTNILTKRIVSTKSFFFMIFLACVADETKPWYRTIPGFSFVCNAGYDLLQSKEFHTVVWYITNLVPRTSCRPSPKAKGEVLEARFKRPQKKNFVWWLSDVTSITSVVLSSLTIWIAYTSVNPILA